LLQAERCKLGLRYNGGKAPMFLPSLVLALLAATDRGPRPAAPFINPGGIVNAATHRPAPDNFVCPGGIISIYGTGLATVTREVRPGDVENGFLPETLAGVAVFFGPVAAPLFYVSPLQINAQVPTVLQPGDWEVRVRVERLEGRERVVVRPYSPGLFAVARHTDGTPVSAAAPARPGEFILFFGAGFGPTRPPALSGALAPLAPVWMTTRIEAEVAGAPLSLPDIYYWGLAPGFAGLYQFNLRIPTPTAAGDVEVRVGVAGEWSQPGFRIAVAGQAP
jgi:uncharacterized protein (TIGR03437 family)